MFIALASIVWPSVPAVKKLTLWCPDEGHQKEVDTPLLYFETKGKTDNFFFFHSHENWQLHALKPNGNLEKNFILAVIENKESEWFSS